APVGEAEGEGAAVAEAAEQLAQEERAAAGLLEGEGRQRAQVRQLAGARGVRIREAERLLQVRGGAGGPQAREVEGLQRGERVARGEPAVRRGRPPGAGEEHPRDAAA